MNYDELVKTLREPCPHENCVLSQQAADAIEELQKKVQEWQEEACKWNNEYFALRDSMPRWISVKERLPEKDGDYLVWVCLEEDVGEPFCGIFPFDANVPDFGRWEEYYDPETYGWSGSEFLPIAGVTHWMPLPTPPKEDEA